MKPARLILLWLCAASASLTASLAADRDSSPTVPTPTRASSPASSPPSRPNILWLTSEDHGPQMGCYGDPYATTPHIDQLAAKGLTYLNVWSCAPVCAPARTTLISGLYPTATGSEHMRSHVPFPQGKLMFPQYLRNAGYYCSNNAKEDYNLEKPGSVWHNSSRLAHWRNRQPDQPFFAVFNSEKSHESKVRLRPHSLQHDPARVRVPAYHPDTPEVRHDWAQYYDGITAVDADAGQRLQELADAGLADDTIVFYFGDHGAGMPRSKRSPCNSGLRVPLVVYIPDKFQHLAPPEYKPGGRSHRLVSFVDFAPTVLSLAGIRPPDWMHGHAFMGPFITKPQPFIHGFRGRMDERLDLARSVFDGRFVYIRNYMPHKIYGQHIAYMFETPTTQIWKKQFDSGQLSPAQQLFWKSKPPEELYDLISDPDEISNLATSLKHQKILRKLRAAQQNHARKIRDVGFLPEGELFSRAPDLSPYDMSRSNSHYPFDPIFQTAESAASLSPQAIPRLKKALRHPDSAVRYWAALGFLMRGPDAIHAAAPDLLSLLGDSSPAVRIAAAEALAQVPHHRSRASKTLAETLQQSDVFTAILALNALEAFKSGGAPLPPESVSLPKSIPRPHPRYDSYVPRLNSQIGRHP